MSEYVDIPGFIAGTKSLGIITGERMSGKTTGLKLYALARDEPTVWLTRYAEQIRDISSRWLSDLQVHGLAGSYTERREKDATSYDKMVYTDGDGNEHTTFFIALSAWRKMRGAEFAANGKKPWAIIFDEFVSDQYLPDEPRKLIDLWATISRRDKPPLLILSGNADDDGTPYNAFFDVSFFEPSGKDEINVLRAVGHGYEETPFAKALSGIMPQYNSYAAGEQKAVVIDPSVEDVGTVYAVYDSAICIHTKGQTAYIRCTDRDPEAVLIDRNGSPTGIMLRPRIVKMFSRLNNCERIFGDRRSVRLWSWIIKYTN